MYVFDIFSKAGLCNMTRPTLLTTQVKNKMYQYLQFNTKSIKEWNELYGIFYKDKEKVIPSIELLEELLTPVSLAYWHMGDGGRTGKAIHLATNAFKTEECERLIIVLNKKFSLDCTLHKRNRIYLPVKSAVEFCKIITPHGT
uniref:hypothetical protein n=1 Tax=Drechslerella dactyloides TaxID=74499 RepID=UPI0022FD79C8|nr:hypothetical protein PNX16_mgp035 [Drechslerella dactyloides]WAN89816.1 hypothetical protein [Drechslerella dactyloides]